MAKPYSVRVILTSGAGKQVTYTPPAGTRFVVRVMDAMNFDSVARTVFLSIGPITVWSVTIPGAAGVAHLDTRQVVNAGEVMTVTTNGTSMNACVSGYSLDASGAAAADPGILAEPPATLDLIGRSSEPR